MKRRVFAISLAFFLLAALTPFVSAQIEPLATHGQDTASDPVNGLYMFMYVTVIATVTAMTLASAVAMISQSRALVAAAKSIARNPSGAGNIQTLLIIGLALIESLAIYVLLVVLILYFANPFVDLLV